jgi:GNAT superfamily N-acetyltransferase
VTTPTTTDAADLARALEFERRLRRAAVQEARPHPLGEALFHRDLERAYVLNALHVDARAGADELVTALDDLYAGFIHRRAFVEDGEVGAALAPDFRERGWTVERDVYMVLRAERDRPAEPGLAREVDELDMRAAEAAFMREERYGRDEDVVRQVLGSREALAAGAARSRWFVAAAEDVDAATATLYSDGRVAQVDDVGTLGDFRRRGLARAAVSAAVDAALEMGHELIFIVADDDDWPKELYAKLGFVPVGTAWGFLRPGPELAGGSSPVAGRD